MENKKLTPEDRADIVRRAAADEKQADLAREYDVTPSRISQIIREDSEAENTYTKDSESFKAHSEEELRHRGTELREVLAYKVAEKHSKLRKYHDLKKRIEWETAQLELLTDSVEREGIETAIKGMRQQMTSLKDHTQLDRTIINAHEDRGSVLFS